MLAAVQERWGGFSDQFGFSVCEKLNLCARSADNLSHRAGSDYRYTQRGETRMSSKRCLLAIALALTVQCGLQAQTRTTAPAARTKAVASRSVSSRPATASRTVRQTSNVIDETIIEEPYL